MMGAWNGTGCMAVTVSLAAWGMGGWFVGMVMQSHFDLFDNGRICVVENCSACV